MISEEYKKGCGYVLGGLANFIYLIPYDSPDRFSFEVDDGQCKALRLNDKSGILRIDGYGATMRNAESNEGRIRYESQVAINIRERMNEKMFECLRKMAANRYYVVVEDKMGVQYVQSVEFYSEFQYTMSVTDAANAQNRVELRFLGASNYPTMILTTPIKKSDSEPFISYVCGFERGDVTGLRICESGYVGLNENNHNVVKVITTAQHFFKDVDFLSGTFTYTQTYANGTYEDELVFSIPLSAYKEYWHYNLVEFKDNRYVATFKMGGERRIITGFKEGATCTYVIETSNVVSTLNKITITLRYISNEGFYTSTIDDKNLFVSDASEFLMPAPDYVAGYATKECQQNGMAQILLVQKYTSTGSAINEYMVLEGYEERFAGLNIVGTYKITDDLGFPLVVEWTECSGGQCNTSNTISNPYIFSSGNPTHRFDFYSSCNYKFIGIPSWLVASFNDGTVKMELFGALPTTSTGTTFYIETADGTRYPVIVQYTASGDATGWDVLPRETYTTSEAQLVTLGYYGDATSGDLEITAKPLGSLLSEDSIQLVSVGNGQIILSIKENPSDRGSNQIYYVYVRHKGKDETILCKIYQSSRDEDWRVTTGYICENGNKYEKLELYIGHKPRGVYKAGNLIESGSRDCEKYAQYKWVTSDDTICDGVNEYFLLKEQMSVDGGITWTDTGETRTGDIKEYQSEKCDPEHVTWKNTGEKECDGLNLCEIWQKYVDNVAVELYEDRNCVPSEEECSNPTKWEMTEQTQCVDRGDGICDSWYLLEKYISYDDGATWEATGEYKVSDHIAVEDDYSCNCPKHEDYKYKRWVWDGKGFLCDDSSYDCRMTAMWVPYGAEVTYGTGYTANVRWTNKTITEIPEVCDFNDTANMMRFAQDCENLVKCAVLNCSKKGHAEYAFDGCVNLENMPISSTNCNITHAMYMFRNCVKLNGEYTIKMQSVMDIGGMFYGSGIKGFDFVDAQLSAIPTEDTVQNSEMYSLKGLNFRSIATSEKTKTFKLRSSKLYELQVKNICVNCDFYQIPNLTHESLRYMYDNASTTDTMVWNVSRAQYNRWGSLPTGKSNITFTIGN